MSLVRRVAHSVAFAAAVLITNPSSAATCPALLKHTFRSLQDDKPQDLCQYAGKVILVVNTASHCGFSPQERGLQALLDKYGPRGFVVLGFPSNDFHQELDDPTQIVNFSRATYGATFPLFAPSHVTGADANPLFAELIRDSGTSPKWNFYKYLIGRDGHVIDSYSSLTYPDNAELDAAIVRALAQRP
ncbi:hydroperoxy fatty acid reductase gpx1 [mine drainage metagenome]|jgi:glutathione peroxidase|uniref:Hydroperoxy fatty acid reductase gpx1 n=1 Tax=mine drainage metagenome TaxID=410659 RepID=A0A1J5RN60_9ZZZZ